MGSNLQSALVDHTLHELLFRNSSTKEDRKPMIHALLTTHVVGMEQGLQYVKNLAKDDVSLRFTADDSLLAQYPLTQLVNIIENDHWVSKTQLHDSSFDPIDIILIPIFSLSLATNILLFNDQNTFVRIILKALFSGKKVIGLRIGTDPYHPIWTLNGLDKAPHVLKRNIANQMKELTSMGIQLINEDEKLVTFDFQNKTKSVITEKTIRYFHQQNYQKIVISQETIITPLALDMAKELAISLIKN